MKIKIGELNGIPIVRSDYANDVTRNEIWYKEDPVTGKILLFKRDNNDTFTSLT